MEHFEETTQEGILEAYLAYFGPMYDLLADSAKSEIAAFQAVQTEPPAFSGRYLKEKLQQWAQEQYDSNPVMDESFHTPQDWARLEILVHFETFAHLVGWPSDSMGYPCVVLEDQLVEGIRETVVIPIWPDHRDTQPGCYLLPDDDYCTLPPAGLEPWQEELYLSMRDKGSSHAKIMQLFEDEDKLKEAQSSDRKPSKGVSPF